MQNNQQKHAPRISNRLKLGITGIAASAILFSSFSHADGPWSHHSSDKQADCYGVYHDVGMLTHGLKLTSEQEQKITSILDSQKNKTHENDKAIRKNQKELFDMVTGSTFDEARADQLTLIISKATANNLLIRAQSSQQIYQLLNIEQKKKFEERRNRFESHHKGT